MIVYEGNAAFYDSNAKSSGAFNFEFLDDPTLQGFDGISWYHYYKDAEKSMFTVAGLGIYTFDGKGSNDPGGALLRGGGYKFTRHIQAGLYLGAGKTTNAGVDFTHYHLSILLDAIAF